MKNNVLETAREIKASYASARWLLWEYGTITENAYNYSRKCEYRFLQHCATEERFWEL